MPEHAKLLHRIAGPALVVGVSALSGCTLWMRDAEFYGEEITELLESRSEGVEACYDRYLEHHDPKAKGELVVEFDVQQRTGQLSNVEVVADQTTVPEDLAACVVDELPNMKLEPVDAKTAHGTFTWVFNLGSRKRPPADPFLAAQQAVLACYSSHLGGVDREAKGDLVIDYAFNRETGALDELEVVAEATTAPQAVVDCAVEILAAAKLEPSQLDDRNAAGRRSFALRFDPYKEPG
jgi:hypothetical protein